MATLPPLAVAADLSAWLGDTSIDDTVPRVGAVLSAASVLIRSYCGQDFTDVAVPDAVVQVCVQVAGRIYTTAQDGLTYTQDQAGPFGTSVRFGGDGGPYLTKGEKQVLAPYRKAVVPGISTLATTRGEPYLLDQYVPVEGGAPMPFLPEGQ